MPSRFVPSRAVELLLTPASIEVRLTAIEKVGALRGDLSIPRERIREARVDDAPLRSIRWKLAMGLRIPGRLYVCHTARLSHFWAIRRGVPAVHLTLDDGRRLREVTVSTPDAQLDVDELRSGRPA